MRRREVSKTIHNDAERIKERLSALPGVVQVTRGWPRSLAQLPCIAVSKAADTPIDYRDDRAYAAKLEYYIRIFAAKAQETDTLAESVDAAMEELGYARTFSYDDDDSDVRIAALRYRKYV